MNRVIDKNLYTKLNAMTIDEFLLWFKKHTEEAWHNIEEPTVEKCYKMGNYGGSWRKDTKWIGGFSDDIINSIEEKWDITFPSDYTRYLSILGATDKLYFVTDSKGLDSWEDDSMIQTDDKPSFYNWQKDTDALTFAFDAPLEGILWDVETSNIWFESWGEKPNTPKERQKVVSKLIDKAPKLIPIYGHRYILDYLVNSTNIVLSVHQTDIIIYGKNLRNYLISELHNDLLDIDDDVYKNTNGYFDENELKAIPFWGEIIYGNLQPF